MAEPYNVFISWSGPRSKSAAEALKEWLPTIIQAARPWLSATDIDKGARWRDEVTAALDTVKAGIICLTPENLTAEWLLFEAGALSKTREHQTRIWTYLLAGLKAVDIKDPLAMFQATTAEKYDTRRLVSSVNKNLGAAVEESTLNYLFDKLWPDLEEKLNALPLGTTTAPKRAPDEIAGETLDLLRSIFPLIQGIAAESQINRKERLLDDALRKAFARNATTNLTALRDLAGSSSLYESKGGIDALVVEPTEPET